MKSNYMIGVDEVSKELGVSRGHAYKIIRTLNDELWNDKSNEEWKAMTPLLKEQLEVFKVTVPEFKVALAVLHFDESSPHMQVVGVPVATGYQRGMKKQVAKTKLFIMYSSTEKSVKRSLKTRSL